jgi:DNA repair protein RadA/Sms
MAKPDTVFICQSCGALSPKWAGKCDACGAWNTLQEESARAAPGAMKTPATRSKSKIEFVDLAADVASPDRYMTGIAELDRVCGGGLASASAVLIGGDPGIGKSTLLLQAAAGLARAGLTTAYVTGEEAEAQIQERARRLGVANAPVSLAAETDLRKVIDALKTLKPDVAIIDSIQTLWADHVDSAPGTVTQVRACSHELVRFRSGRPRDQGWPDRRPARSRAHGRCGDLFRGRTRPCFPHPARRQKPVRADRRDRRVRNE